jgi:uncharacterized membrane protein YadS
MLMGVLVGNLLRVDQTNAHLVSVGTAIWGGSAIVAVGNVMNTNDEQRAVSLGLAFILKTVGLKVFPLIGSAVGLTQTQFGLWAALAIHNTSSVVGAGTKYGVTTMNPARVLDSS